MKIRNQIENKINDLTEEAFDKAKRVRYLANNDACFDGPKIAALIHQSNLLWNQIEVLKEFGGKYRKKNKLK